MKRCFFCIMAAITMMFVIMLPASVAQTGDTGAIAGTITDPSGAIVPGAVITATSIDTGQVRTVTSGPNGTYRFALLQPGRYKVRVEAQGFKTMEIPELTIVVTETRTLDRKLEIGAPTEQITVQAEAAAIQTENSTLGSVVSGESITDIPLASRNYANMLSLAAGTSATVTDATSLGKGTQSVAVGGSFSSQNNYQMDGASIVNYSAKGGVSESGSYGAFGIPNPDAIQEFKIQTSQYDAGFGRNAGANVNVLTKSGTNAFHGSAFEFFRNTVLNANNWFSNRSGSKRGVLNQHQFGGTLGGPIKKDKLHFFVSFQETDQKNAIGSAGMGSFTNMNLPLAERGSCPAGVTSVSGCDSAAQNFARLLGANYAGLSGWKGGVPVAADGSNINPVSLRLLQLKLPNGAYYLPSSNGTNTAPSISCTGLNCVASVPAIYHEYQGMGNWDYIVNSKNTLMGRYFVSVSPRLQPFYSGSNVPGIGSDASFNNHEAVLKLTSIPTNSMVNEFRLSYQRNIIDSGITGDFKFTQIGGTPIDPALDVLPTIRIGNMALGTPMFALADNTSNQYQVADQVSWIQGRHSLRFGFEVGFVRWNFSFLSLEEGGATFNTVPDFLLGLPGCTPGDTACSPTNPGATNGTAFSNLSNTGVVSTRYTEGFSRFHRRSRTFSGFVQDDIKVTPRFTVNAGMRWEYFGYPIEMDGKSPNMNIALIPADDLPQVSAKCAIGDLTCGTLVGYQVPANWKETIPAGVTQISGDSVIRQDAPKKQFAPRLGFSWQPFDTAKFAVRGGAGIFYDLVGGDWFTNGANSSPPYAMTVGGAGADVYFASFQKPYPDTQPTWLTRWVTASGLNSNLLQGSSPDKFLTPTVYTWNLNVQYEFLPTYVLELGYIGSRGIHVMNGATANSPFNPALLNNAAITGAAPSVSNAKLRSAYLGLGNGNYLLMTNADMKYHGLQTTVRKQYSNNLSFQGTYSWNRAFASTWIVDGSIRSVDDKRFPLAPIYGPNSEYAPHRVTLQFTYELPHGGLSGLAEKLLGGWRLSGQATIQQGRPLHITDNGLGSIFGLSGTGFTMAQFCPNKTVADIATSGSTQDRVNSYFNRSAFAGSACAAGGLPTVAGTDGTGGGNVGRGIILGPGQHNWDMTINKRIKVGGINEDATVEFRTEFFNAFNHPQFGNPTTDLSNARFGQISNTSVNPRLIQFALKYMF